MSFSLIRRAARGIKYSTVEEFVNQEVTFSDRMSIIDESTVLARQLYPESSFVGPTQNQLEGQIAKYGILDLQFSADPSHLQRCNSGVPVLRELGLVGQDVGPDDLDLEDDDLFAPMSGVQIVLEDLEESVVCLKLFLRSKSWIKTDMKDGLQRINNPNLLDFPKTFTVTDACLTNVGSAWLMKHFYL